MKTLDPLTLKIKQLLEGTSPNPLSAARTQYGSRDDYRLLGLQLREDLRSSPDVILVDLSPFGRIGNKAAFNEFVLSVQQPERVLFIVSTHDLLAMLLERRVVQPNFSYVLVDDSASMVSGEGPALLSDDVSWLQAALDRHATLSELKRHTVGLRLLEWVRETIITAESHLVPETDVVVLDNRKYIRMQTGMVVSSYVNMKAILSNPERLIDIAVEVCWQLFDGFRRDQVAHTPDWVVVPNNTALQLGAAVQAIAQIPLAVVDHIGPVPAVGLIAQRVSAELRGSTVALLTDVSATGGEIDRSILFLHGLGAKICEVICPVWLEVGRCQLISGMRFVPLCLPKKALGYEYRSE